MTAFPPVDRSRLTQVCDGFHVRRLDVFGSAAREFDFGEDSDIDLLVEFEPEHTPPALGDFLSLRGALSNLFGRSVDLAMNGAIRDPYLRASIERSKRTLHGA